MSRSITVLLIDDDIYDDRDGILDDLTKIAKQNRVIIKKAITNAKEGIQYIKQHKNEIDAIILDGFFLQQPDSSKKKDIGALKQTIDELKKLLYAEKVRIPFCVLTGYLEDLSSDSLLSDVKVFRKGRSVNEMLSYLKEQVAHNDSYQIKSEYEEIFELFESELMPADKEEDLVEILRKLKSKAKYNDDDAFTPIRKMYEALVNEMHDQALAKNKNQDIVPEALYNERDNLSISWSWFYLSGFEVKNADKIEISARDEAVWPPHVAKVSKMLIDMTQEGSHDYPENVHHYAYKSAVFALLEVMLWYKQFIKSYV